MRLQSVFVFIVLGHFAFSQAKPKVVIVIADGIPADVIERLKPANLLKIASDGAYKRMYVGGETGTYKETPTISAPGYNDMLTGTWAYKHNVWDNDNQKPNYHYPTIFSLVRNAKPDADLAIFSTWIENRKTLIGAGLPGTNKLKLDDVYDGYEKDTLLFPHDTSSLYLHNIDEHVIHEADSVIRKKGPDLSWIYLEYTDDIGHSKGTGIEFDSAILLLDLQMKVISDAIHFREKTSSEKWLFIITTDHGRDSLTGAGHGGQSERERTTWVIMNQKDNNVYFKSFDPAIIDILPTTARYLNVQIPKNTERELDGTSMIGPVSVAKPEFETDGDKLKVQWQNLGQPDNVSVYISYTNLYKSGGEDKFELLGKPKNGNNHFEKTIKNLKDRSFYKIVIKGKYNEVNIWKTLPNSK
jgi:Type I phosphodiesterase / nucleotide pyrophosphatase